MPDMTLRRGGFTLIELLAVIVIIGILATIGVNRFWTAKDRALRAAVQADLKNVAAQQEAHFGTAMTYAGSTAALANFAASNGVDLVINSATPGGWAATATHASLAGIQCGLFVGDAPAADGAPAVQAGIVTCAAGF
jgi:prepilin-type N-terminal cleavage/methylation domain-containing protein